jgi:energy-coupling factor transport system permease protein
MSEFINIKTKTSTEFVTECKKSALSKMDAGIKLVISITFAFSIFICKNPISFFIISAFICVSTIFSGISKNVIIKNITPFIVMILLPYVFSIVILKSILLFCNGNFYFFENNTITAIFRTLKIILLSYIGCLYLCSTSIWAVASLFDKLFSPLKRLSVPVSDYIRILVIILCGVPKSAGSAKDIIIQNFTSIRNKNRFDIREFFKTITNSVVAIIANSFQNVEQVHEILNNKNSYRLDSYHYKASKKDLFGVFFFVIIITLLILIEKNFVPSLF